MKSLGSKENKQIKPMNICVAANAKYEKYLSVMLCSLAETNKENDIEIYILNADFSINDKNELLNTVEMEEEKIHFVKIKTDRFSELPTTLEYSKEAYFRLLMADVLQKEIDRVLYLDVDVLVTGNLRELYETDLTGSLAAVCQDMGRMMLDDKRKRLFRRKGDDRYFNSGVMLWNLSNCREIFSFSDYMSAAKDLGYDLPCVDQDILNYMLYDKVKYLDPMKYNLLLKEVPDDIDIIDTKIIHFCGRAPWVYPGQSWAYKKWWEYASRTPFYLELLEGQNKRVFDRYFKVDFPQEKEMRAVLELALKIKGKSKVERYIKEQNKPFILYGCGYMAEKLIDVFTEEPGIYIFAAVDKSKQGRFHDILIHSDFSGIKGEGFTVIVTPTRDTETIIRNIADVVPRTADIITLRSFLENANKYGDGVA